jgi:hypothetical protein
MYTMTSLLLKQSKGSKILRKNLGYDSPLEVNYNIDRGRNILHTDRLYESEIQSGYRAIQTRIFTRELLDYKSRFLLGKFNLKNLSKMV